jgi:predicted RNase H-like nuclease (RuvC/YqgF family)
MNYGVSATSLLVALFVVAPVAGEIRQQAPGEDAPFAGVLFDQAALTQLIEELRTARSHAEQVQLLSESNRVLQEKISSLERELAERMAEATKQAQALALADDREQRREVYEQRVDKLLVRAEQTIEHYDQLVVKLNGRVESLEKRMWFMQILGPLGFIAGIFVP